ncbi:MAG: ArsA family ATPase [Methanocellales archaeon]|nr:ArsA family ATPase [Methanocellales archaeon]
MVSTAPSFLGGGTELIFFGGKGGVGKTTCAAATALKMAEQGRKTLIMSINPAHSLSDIFESEIGSKITQINDNLWGLEIKAEELVDDYKRRNTDYITTIVDRGTYADTEDISNFLDLSLPGIDEIIAMLKLMDLMKEGKYELLIIDTAATGHMVRFLSLPKLMDDFVCILDRLQEKYRYIVSSFRRGRYRKDYVDKWIESQKKDVKELRTLITSSRTEFVPVTIPEAMGIEETELLIKAIEENGINVKSIILNMVNLSAECDFCASRKKDQEKYVRRINSLLPGYNIIQTPLFPNEIKGLDSLLEFGGALSGGSYGYKPTERVVPRSRKMMNLLGQLTKKMSRKRMELSKYQLLLFGGKGGLGKTTVAAATALYMAKTLPDKRILIFSTDPVQALGRSFDLPISTDAVQINDNLYAVAMDADAALEEFKKEYVEEINEVFDAFMSGSAGLEFPYDRDIFNRAIELSPPGLDELMALSKIIDLMDEKKYDIFILDTAPSGHLLRLLELPELVMDWSSALIKTMLKYRGIVSLTKTMRVVLTYKKRLKSVIELLRDPKRTEFVVVTVPEALGVVETGRVLTRLQELNIPTHRIVINRVTPPTNCSFCASRREREQKYIKEINKKFSGYAISEMPLFSHEIRGVDDLTNFAEVMYS